MKKLFLLAGLIPIILSMIACSADTENSDASRCPFCEYEGVCYRVRDQHPKDNCLICGDQGYWIEAGDFCCIDNVTYEDGCCINGVFYPDGTINPGNECKACSAYENLYSWSERFGCCIDGVFYPDGTINPGNECEACLPLKNRYAWSKRTGCCIGETYDFYGSTGKFYPPGTINPENDCEWCVAPKSFQIISSTKIVDLVGHWSAREKGEPCEGGNCDGVGNCVE